MDYPGDQGSLLKQSEETSDSEIQDYSGIRNRRYWSPAFPHDHNLSGFYFSKESCRIIGEGRKC